MNLFKERLKHTCLTLLSYILVLAGMVLLMWLFSLLPNVVVCVIAYIIFGLLIVGGLYAFIYWLFIEPFRKGE